MKCIGCVARASKSAEITVIHISIVKVQLPPTLESGTDDRARLLASEAGLESLQYGDQLGMALKLSQLKWSVSIL